MTLSTAELPGHASRAFRLVAYPHRTGEYVSCVLGCKTPWFRGLETSRDAWAMNNLGLLEQPGHITKLRVLRIHHQFKQRLLDVAQVHTGVFHAPQTDIALELAAR